MEDTIVLAVDTGHSKVKYGYAVGQEEHSFGYFPTLVMNHFDIKSPETKRIAEAENLVVIDGKKYFIGDTVSQQLPRRDFTKLTHDWTETVEHDALLLGAIQKIDRQVHLSRFKNVALVVGLPTSYYRAFQSSLLKRAEELLASVLNEKQQFRVFVRAQSEAPIACLQFEADGSINTKRDMKNERWGIVECGHYTTDITFWDEGNIINSKNDSIEGAKIVSDDLKIILQEKGIFQYNNLWLVRTLEHRENIYNGEVRNFTEEVANATATYYENIVTGIDTYFSSDIATLNGILICGGGKSLIFNRLCEEYGNVIKQIPYVNTRFVVAESYLRTGLAMVKYSKIFN